MTRNLADSRSQSARSLRMLLKGSTMWHEAAADGCLQTLKQLAAEAVHGRVHRHAQRRRQTRLQQTRQQQHADRQLQMQRLQQQLYRDSDASSGNSSIGANSDDSEASDDQSVHSHTPEAAQLGSVSEGVAKAANALTKSGKTPLMLACRGGHVQCVEFLLQCGAIVDIRCKKLQKTCLHYAVEGGHTQIAAKLLLAAQQQQLQVDPQEEQSISLLEAQDGRGHTALHCAVAANSEDTVALLLAHGANTRARAAHSGKPCDVLVLADDLPMHIAASVGNLNIVKMLLRVHVELEGDAPLSVPTLRSDPHLDPRYVRNCYRRTPYQTAMRMGATWLAEALDPSYPARLVLWGQDAPVNSAAQHIPRLAIIAAGALQAKLEQELNNIQAAALNSNSQGSHNHPTAVVSQQTSSGIGRRSSVDNCSGGRISRASRRSLSRLSRASNVALVMNAPAAAVLDAEDDCCGVCLERVPDVTVAPCKHKLCVECARGVCKSYAMAVPLCPFCRGFCTEFTH